MEKSRHKLSFLLDKPWEESAEPAPASVPLSTNLKTESTALKVLLMVITSLFFLLTVAFIVRTQYEDWQPLSSEPWQPLFNTSMLWLNTGYLFCASLLLQWSVRFAKQEKQKEMRIGLTGALMFTLLFLIGQLLLWQHFNELGYFVDANPANSFYFLLTGMHGAHLLGGLIAWGFMFWRIKVNKAHKPVSHYIQLCATYWHYLFVLWLVLFALLVSTPETYKAIAAFCGIQI